MNDPEVIKILQNNLGFSESSIKKLKKFNNLLLNFNKSYNLISKNTEKAIWTRHILDSAQLIKFIDIHKNKSIADLGSGAGFPGVVIALFAQNSKFHVKLFEKSPVKRSFLNDVKDKLDINHIEIVEDVYQEKINADIIVCRAFKKLEEILRISREIAKKPHKLIILKGKNAQSEINSVSLGSNYSYKLERSLTDNDSKIIVINVKKNGK